MDATPSAVARTISRRLPTPDRVLSGGHASAGTGRRRGDGLTADPEDRRRRARAALLELEIALAFEQAGRRSY